jgi:hypothetical protein
MAVPLPSPCLRGYHGGMDPFEHWVDIDLDPELAGFLSILSVVGIAYFGYLFWQMKRRQCERPRDPP